MLIFRQLFDAQSSTYTYLLGDSGSGEAVLIDPVFEQVRRDGLVADQGAQLRWIGQRPGGGRHPTVQEFLRTMVPIKRGSRACFDPMA